MSKHLMLMVFGSALCHGQELLDPITPDRMRHRYGVEADLMGISYHTKRDQGYNERNYGGGISLTIGSDTPDDGRSAVMCLSFGSYKDSYNERSNYVLAGPRGVLGYRDGVHVAVACLLGYVGGSDIHGAAILPTVSVGYNRIDLVITGDPFANDTTESKFIAAFIKIRLLDF